MIKKLIVIALILLIPNFAGAFGPEMFMIGGESIAPSNPGWGTEIDRLSEAASGATSVVTLTGGIAQNNRIIVAVSWNLGAGSQTLTSVTDSKSNSYTIHEDFTYVSVERVAIASANAATALVATDTVTVTWGSPSLTYRGVMVAYGDGIATSGQPDQNTNNSGNSTSPSASASTTASDTLCFGVIRHKDGSITYGSSDWTVSGAVHSFGGDNQAYYVYSVESSSGSKDPGGTLTGADNWGVVWVSFD